MYPGFHLHHPGYAPIPPTPPPVGPAAFSEATANAAGTAARQHNVYVHGLDGFGYRRWPRRGPSRLKWFILGGLATFAYFKHRQQQSRFATAEDCDPRQYLWNCKRRREDLPSPSDHAVEHRAAAQASPTQQDGPTEIPREREWQSRWHKRWHAHDRAPKVEPPMNNSAPADIPNPADALLTYDNAALRDPASGQAPTQRERMEAEAIAFAEEKIDSLMDLLEGLRSKLNETSKK
ncbi:hypothetical protein NliqN6_5001 [Naganishia liquefaciens]|uniref:Uncharacterized protein n=1 Tax=Naganishia liquefaciens TaxID=104408 RepID=A0A8H3YGC8_9TREE|nr:hypothetical protein NliqN6_5001 [Naganishia liquefaciens]